MAGLLGLLPTAVGLIAQGVNYFGADEDQEKAQKALDELGKQPLARYGVNSRYSRIYNKSLADQIHPMGYSAAEKTGFDNRINTILSTRFNTGRRFGGGNVTRILNGMNVGDLINAENTFASQDSTIKRDNIRNAQGREAAAAGIFQNADNMNTTADINRRLQTEQRLGEAVAGNRGYKRNMLGNIGSDLMTAGTYGLVNGFGDPSPTANPNYGYPSYTPQGMTSQRVPRIRKIKI